MGFRMLPGAGLLADAPASGMVLITTSSFTSAGTASVDGCFTGAYENYRIILDLTAASTALSLTMRMRVGGADNSSASYKRQRHEASGATITASIASAQTSWALGNSNIDATTAPRDSYLFDLYGPYLTRYTTGTYHSFFYDTGGTYLQQMGFGFEATTSFDGFSIIASTGNISGTASVYAYA